ncbi:MAG: hypothetical protein WCK27_23300 [Verrucomicrobiota bacterium]
MVTRWFLIIRRSSELLPIRAANENHSNDYRSQEPAWWIRAPLHCGLQLSGVVLAVNPKPRPKPHLAPGDGFFPIRVSFQFRVYPWCLEQKFLLKSRDAVQVYSNFQAIKLQLRHEVPTEVDLAATSLKTAAALTPEEVRISFGQLSAVVAEAEERQVRGHEP